MPELSLRFRDDGRFTIVQFTDLHWQNGEEQDAQTRAMMERVLDIERPDLVALTGDVIAGRHCVDPSASFRAAVEAIEERSLPWAAIFGNHDDEGSCDRARLMEAQRSCRFCLSESGPDDVTGIGNYVLRLGSSGNRSLAAALYFLDSGSYAPKPLDGYGWIARDQIAWYLDSARRLGREYTAAAPEAKLPALAFFHIPVPEYNEVWDLHPCKGHKYEDVCCPQLNSGLFAAMCEAGDVLGTFVGHDHVNDYEGTLHGIRLCYGRWGGYHTYGQDRFVPGARVIQLREGERGFTTWLRLADGSAVTKQPAHQPRGRVTSEG